MVKLKRGGSRETGREDYFCLLDRSGPLDVVSGQFQQFCLSFSVRDLAGVPPAFVSLVAQKDSA